MATTPAEQRQARDKKKSLFSTLTCRSISTTMPLDPSHVHKPVKKLRTLVKKMPEQPPPEQVHDVRTDTRRVEATVNALSMETSGNVKKMLKDLSRIRKRAGKMRDMDVLTR